MRAMPAVGGEAAQTKAQRPSDRGVASPTRCDEALGPARCMTLALWIPACGWRGMGRRMSLASLAGLASAAAAAEVEVLVVEAAAAAAAPLTQGPKGWGWEAEPAQVAAHWGVGVGVGAWGEVCLRRGCGLQASSLARRVSQHGQRRSVHCVGPVAWATVELRWPRVGTRARGREERARAPRCCCGEGARGCRARAAGDAWVPPSPPPPRRGHARSAGPPLGRRSLRHAHTCPGLEVFLHSWESCALER